MKYHELLKQDRPCPFCDTSERGILIENKNAFLTYSLAPYAPDHLLICPRRHVTELLSLAEDEHVDILALQKEGFALLKKAGHENITLLYREGPGSGKSIPHLHYHLVPDVVISAPINIQERVTMDDAEIAEVLERLRAYL